VRLLLDNAVGARLLPRVVEAGSSAQPIIALVYVHQQITGRFETLAAAFALMENG